jgi:HemY protein
MTRLLKIWLVILLGAGIGVIATRDNGYVMLAFGVYTVEMSLVLLLIIIAMLFAVMYFSIRALVRFYRLPSDVKDWSQRRGNRAAQNAMTRGLLELSEGQWRKAEKRLVKFADRSETPLLNYLAAARAAQLQGAHERRDSYIRLAHKHMPSGDVAVSITQAELQMADHQLDQALDTLRHLRDVAPNHTYVLRLLMDLYDQVGDWERLSELMPELRKRKVSSAEQLKSLEKKAYKKLLEASFLDNDPEQLSYRWRNMPKALREDPALIADYASYLQERERHQEAEELLRQALKRGWDVELVELYGQLECPNAAKHLSRVEAYLKKYPNDATLLLSLGRLCLHSQLWGKARAYLEASVGNDGPVAAYRELARLLEHMDEPEKALSIYRQAVSLEHDDHLIALPEHIGHHPRTSDAQ